MTLSVKIKKTLNSTNEARHSEDREGRSANDRAFSLDVEFDVPAGFTILFGASGSGKTTTLRSILGLAALGWFFRIWHCCHISPHSPMSSSGCRDCRAPIGAGVLNRLWKRLE